MARSSIVPAALLLPGLLLAAAVGWWGPKEPLPVALLGVGAVVLGFLLGGRVDRGHRGGRSERVGEPQSPPPRPEPSPRPVRSGKVVHDINNVLTAINGRTEMVLHALPEAHPLREDVLHIQEAGREAARLAATLRTGGGGSVPPSEILSPAGVVRDLIPGLRALLGENQTLSFHVQEPLPLVAAGRAGVEQMLENMVRNAVKAMPEGGRVTVALSGVEDGVLFTVEDTGSGMTPEVRSRALEPFFSGWARPGSGLGLSTVQSLVRRLGGGVELDSAPGEGTRVLVWLPGMPAVVEGEDPDTGPEGGSARGAAGSGETILLVEDEEMVRSLAERILAGRGYGVLAAAGGDEALAMAAGWDGPIHLVLSDVVMPGMSGPETVGRLAETGRTFKVLYISGYTADHLGPYGVLEEGIELLSKPFGPDALARRVREVLAR